VGGILDSLLALQERDLALDRLQHRHDTLPERADVARLEALGSSLLARRTRAQAERDELARQESRLDDEAHALATKAKDVEARMYSGEVSSPRELQAMQADVEQLQRHQRDVENRELEVMEQREPVDAQLAELDTELGGVARELDGARSALAAAESEIGAETAVERAARDEIAGGLDHALVADYERRRAHAHGVGAARLVGSTCQGCHLSIPSTEVERIRHAPEGSVAYCDNCGCILVP
jgi:predicted  nucleic acid-binding Zn-ribbon protein